MTEANAEVDEVADPLSDVEELLFRQVPPAWVDDCEPTSQAFRPTKKDEGQLSVSLGSLTSAEQAYVHHTTVLQRHSAGSWGISVGEVVAANLMAFPDEVDESPAHGYVDFSGLSKGDCEKRSKLLLARARARGRLHP